MSEDDTQKQLGQLALDNGLVTPEQLREALGEFQVRKAVGSRLPLGEVFVELGFMTRSQLDTLLKAQGGKKGPREQIEGFELIRKLGEGGMGATYLARQVSMDRLVALKVLRKALSRDGQFVSRFVREAQLAGKLDHVNIVQAIDVGRSGGFHYLIMEYVEGRSLTDLMPESGGMDEGLALHLIIQMARALEFANRHGIIHRDIKPDNIMVTGDNIAKLCDFGLARQTGTETRLTQTGMAMGTPHYISPEQARGEGDVDIRTDIYSLGATLYHLVTGETPFDGTTAAVIMTKHLTDQMPWPQDINPNVSTRLCHLIEKMMAKEREDRYQTPRELLSDLELVVDGKEPGSSALSPGMSSVATRGTVPIVAAAPAARPKPFRQTRRMSLPGTDPTLPVSAAAGGVTDASRLKLLVAGVAAAGLLVVALLVWALAGGSDNNQPVDPRGGKQPPRDRPEPPPPKGSDELREMYDYALKWWKEHPEDFAEARRKFEGLRGKAGGLLAMKIDDAVREIDRAEKLKLDGVLGPLEKRAGQLAGIGDFDGALAVLDGASRDARKLVGGEIDRLRAELQKKAEGKLGPIIADAERLSRDGRPAEALARLKDLRGARYAPVTGKVATLRARLEKEKQDTSALTAKRSKAAARKQLVKILDEVDGMVAKGKREEASRRLARRSKSVDPAVRKLISGELAAMARIIKEMQLFDQAHEKSVAALVGRKVQIKTEDGTVHKCTVRKVVEHEGFIEVERSYSIMGRPRTRRYKIRFDKLAEGEFEKLIKGREPTTPEAFMAMAVMAIHGGDVGFAPEALKGAGENPLRDYYGAKLKSARKNAGEGRARWEWENEVLPKVREKYSREQAGRLFGQVDAWLKENRGTRFHAEHRKEAEDLRRRAKQAMGGEPPPDDPDPRKGGDEIPKEVVKFFRGKVKRFDARFLEIELAYDFSDAAQLKDFEVLGGKWGIAGGKLTGVFQKGGGKTQAVRSRAYFEDELKTGVQLTVNHGKQGFLQIGGPRDKVLLGVDFLGFRKKEPKVVLGRDRGEFEALKSKLNPELRPGRTYALEMKFEDRKVSASFAAAEFGSTAVREDKQVRLLLGLYHRFAPRPTSVSFDELRIVGRLDRPWFQRVVEGGGKPEPEPEPKPDRGEHRPGPGEHRPPRKPRW